MLRKFHHTILNNETVVNELYQYKQPLNMVKSIFLKFEQINLQPNLHHPLQSILLLPNLNHKRIRLFIFIRDLTF